MNRMCVLFIVLLFSLLFFGVATLAQDVTVEPTVEVTPEPPPPPVVVEPPAPDYISVSTIVYGILIAILGGGTVGAIIVRFGNTKQNLDAMEKLYLSFPPETKELIHRLLTTVDEAMKIAKKATDGLPNDEGDSLPGSRASPGEEFSF